MMSTPDYDTRDQEGYDHAVENLQEEGARRGRITNTDAALRFVLAGNAYFTLRSVPTSNRFTYRVAMPKKARQDAKLGAAPWYYVRLLNGPDNTRNYTWIGTILSTGKFKLQTCIDKNPGMDAPSVRAFLWFYQYIVESSNRAQLPMTVEFWHEGRCGRCGRLLTVPSSIARGIGPECAGHV